MFRVPEPVSTGIADAYASLRARQVSIPIVISLLYRGSCQPWRPAKPWLPTATTSIAITITIIKTITIAVAAAAAATAIRAVLAASMSGICPKRHCT